MGMALYYNVAAGSFHKGNVVADFYLKNKKSLFEPPFEVLRGNVQTPSIARWKTGGRLPIRQNLTVFAISYGRDVISRYLSKSARFEGLGHFERKIETEGASPTNYFWCQKPG